MKQSELNKLMFKLVKVKKDKMKWSFRLRHISYLFRKDWYGNRLKLIREYGGDLMYKDYAVLIDLGVLTIIKKR